MKFEINFILTQFIFFIIGFELCLRVLSLQSDRKALRVPQIPSTLVHKPSLKHRFNIGPGQGLPALELNLGTSAEMRVAIKSLKYSNIHIRGMSV